MRIKKIKGKIIRFLESFKPLVLLKDLIEKRVTLKFPEESLKSVKNYRGEHLIDKDKCIGCGICKEICPNEAITLDENKKILSLHLGKCCFCGLCAEYCPTNAIKMGTKPPNPTFNKSSVVKKPKKGKVES